MTALELDGIEQRILGSLLEKQATVPASYPLSLNGLRTACNQTSSRDPVTDHDEAAIEATLRGLKDRELVRLVWAGKGSRAIKYHQRLDEHLGLADDERALVTVLLLRGPQSAGELKTRTDRLHHFADKAAVEDCLRRLADRATPLVRVLERRPGQQDPRWLHLLGSARPAESLATAAVSAVDRERVLADGPAARDQRVIAAYDGVAGVYAEHALALPAFDTWLLRRVADRAEGPVADLGCGPGDTTAVLAEAGAAVTGFDLSPRMVDEARRRNPELAFEVGDLTRLLRPRTAAAWGGITAWLSLVHLEPSELVPAFAGFARVLAPGGWLALAVHCGDTVRHCETRWGEPFEVDFVLHDPEEVRTAVAAAGFDVSEWYVRGPVVGELDPNLYVLACMPQD